MKIVGFFFFHIISFTTINKKGTSSRTNSTQRFFELKLQNISLCDCASLADCFGVVLWCASLTSRGTSLLSGGGGVVVSGSMVEMVLR
jgi:hypothetical protein